MSIRSLLPVCCSLAWLCALPVTANAEPVEAQGNAGGNLDVGGHAATPHTEVATHPAEPGLTPQGGDAATVDGAPTAQSRGGLPAEGFQWGLKLGMELPLGKADGGVSVFGQQVRSGDLSGIGQFRVPIALDLGYRLDPKWWLGLEAGVGLGPAGDDCIDGATCDWSSLRLGAQAIVHLDPQSDMDPWLGAILGYEWLSGSVALAVPYTDDAGQMQTGVAKAKEVLGGPQLTLEGGLNFDLGDNLRVGPFATASVGMFITDSFDCPEELGCPDSGSVDESGVHGWLGLGMRGTHGP